MVTRSAENARSMPEAENTAGADEIVENNQEKQRPQRKHLQSEIPRGVPATASGFGVMKF